MIANNMLENNVKQMYDALMHDMERYTYEKLLDIAGNRLKTILGIPYAAIYMYNSWTNMYELKTDPGKMSLLHEICIDFHDPGNDQFADHVIDGTAVFSDEAFDPVILPLLSEEYPTFFILLCYQKNEMTLTVDNAGILKRETEHFFQLLNRFRMTHSESDKNASLFDFSSTVYTMFDKEEILSEFLRCLRKMYPSFSYVLLLSQDYPENSPLPVKTIEYSDEATKRVSLQAFLTGEVQLENRVHDNQSYVYVPLNGRQGRYGVLKITSPFPNGFPDEETAFITKLANTAGAAVENATRYHQSEHLISNLKLINETANKFNFNLRLADIITILRDKILEVCAASEAGFVYFQDDANNQFDILPGSTAYFNSKEGGDFAKHLADQMKINAEAIFTGDFKAKDFDIPYHSLMAVPMVQSGTLYGAAIIMHKESYFFSFDHYKVIKSLVQHSTLAIANSILKHKLEKSVITDYLTNLYSRNYIDETVKTHIKTGENGTLVLFDIDDFKQINDTYGHYIGDEVIVQVASIIREQLGEDDVPARWGGEEFAVYMPNAGIDDGLFLADQILHEVEHVSEPNVTLSAGASSWTDRQNDSAIDVFQRADQALYKAKNAGKNSVVKAREFSN